MRKTGKRWITTRVILSLSMVSAFCCGTLTQAYAVGLQEESTGEQAVVGELGEQPSVDEMLDAGDYVKHEAVALVQQGSAEGEETSARSEALIEGAEVLATVSAASAGTTGEDVDIIAVREDKLSTRKVLNALDGDSRVLAVQPNYVVDAVVENTVAEAADAETDGTENSAAGNSNSTAANATVSYDDYTPYQWAYASKTAGVNPPAWNNGAEHYGDSVVAILDTGVDYTNPDLTDAMFDMSPYVSKIKGYNSGRYGYNAIEDIDNPMDDNGHGTHCAGIVAASDNGFGVTGIAAGASIIGVKAGDESCMFSDMAIFRGFGYLTEAAKLLDGKLKAVNCSWGGSVCGNVYGALVNELGSLGVVTVFASGNASDNIATVSETTSPLWNNPYALTVNASNSTNNAASYSNSGWLSHLYAPGSSILSTVPMNIQSYIPSLVRDNIEYHPFDSPSDTVSLYRSCSSSNSKSKTASLSERIETGFDAEHDAYNLETSGSATVRMGDLSPCADDESKKLTGASAGRQFYMAFEVDDEGELPNNIQAWAFLNRKATAALELHPRTWTCRIKTF